MTTESLPLALRGGRVLRSGAAHPELLDVMIGDDGRIALLGPGGHEQTCERSINIAGKLVSPGLIDVHQHLDKTRTSRLIDNADGTLAGAVAAFNAYAVKFSRDDIIARAERTLTACRARGTTAMRTHANIDPVLRNRAVEALVALRERVKDWMRLQVVAFVTAGATRMGETARIWLEEAIATGADVVGGTPAISDDPPALLDMLFGVAARRGLTVDLHLDEHLDPARNCFETVIACTRNHGMQGRVALGHCSALSALKPDAANRIIDAFAREDIAVIALPSANLFLQGRDACVLPPRGLTRVKELLMAGVRIAVANDNIQDPFVPVGTGDMLEIARWALLAGHLRGADLKSVHTMITQAPAQIMGLGTDYGVREGAYADLLICDAEDAEDLVASGPLERAVMVRGRIVTGQL
jgi:cytosine deaminase